MADPKMSGLYCCDCGVETPCGWTDLNISRFFQCPACKVTKVHLLTLGGRCEWFKLDPTEIDFFKLLVPPIDEDDEN